MEIRVDDGTPYRIKKWQDVADKYGLSDAGNIKTPGRYFRASERYMCGKIVYVRNQSKNRTYDICGTKTGWRWYTVSEEMLEPLYDESDEDIKDVCLVDFVGLLGVSV